MGIQSNSSNAAQGHFWVLHSRSISKYHAFQRNQYPSPHPPKLLRCNHHQPPSPARRRSSPAPAPSIHGDAHTPFISFSFYFYNRGWFVKSTHFWFSPTSPHFCRLQKTGECKSRHLHFEPFVSTNCRTTACAVPLLSFFVFFTFSNKLQK